MLSHKLSYNKIWKTETTQSIFSDNNSMKLEISNRWKTEKKITDLCILNYTLVNKQWIKEEITRDLEKNENKNTAYQNFWDTMKAVFRGKFLAINTYIQIQERERPIG